MFPLQHAIPLPLDCRRPRSITSVTGTKDLQMVNLTLRVLTRPDPAHLPETFKTLGEGPVPPRLPPVPGPF